MHFTKCNVWLVKERIRKGVPDSFRGKIWPMLARVKEQKKKSGISYSVSTNTV